MLLLSHILPDQPITTDTLTARRAACAPVAPTETDLDAPDSQPNPWSDHPAPLCLDDDMDDDEAYFLGEEDEDDDYDDDMDDDDDFDEFDDESEEDVDDDPELDDDDF